jgi:PhnB protein
MSFYARCFETELQMMPFLRGEKPTATDDRIMHAALMRGQQALLMASDTAPGDFKQGNNVWLNVQCETVDEIERLFSALGEGGHRPDAAARCILGLEVRYARGSVWHELDVQL